MLNPEKGKSISTHTMLSEKSSGFVRHLAFLCLMPSPYKTKDS